LSPRAQYLYGFLFHSSFSFSFPPLEDSAPASLAIEAVARVGAGPDDLLAQPLLELGSGNRVTRVARSVRGPILSIASVADFEIGRLVLRVAPQSPPLTGEVEAELLGSAMALWLEQRGVLALHGAALARGSQAAIFLGDSGAGKSTLAAAALRAGWTVLSEDLIAVDVAGEAVAVRPSIPAIRLWPETIREVLGLEVEPLRRVDPRFDKRWVSIPMDSGPPFERLTRIYELNRVASGGAVAIEPRRASEAILAMTRDTFTPRSVVALGWHGARLERLAACARAARFARLTYPSGYEVLPRVLDAVATDMRS
jgi:hypothetical protein